MHSLQAKEGFIFGISMMKGKITSICVLAPLLDNLAHLKILKMRCVVAALALYVPINASLSSPNVEDSNTLKILF